MEELSFHVEFLKMRYFKLAGLEWGFQVPVTKEMVLFVLEKKGIDGLSFEFDRSSPQSYTLSIQIDDYEPKHWQSLKQDIIEVLG